jgi:hypothetical protein
MPKKIITEQTLPIALHELDKWSGKLTWNKYAEHLSKVIGVNKISRHTLLSYKVIVEAFNDKKEMLKVDGVTKEFDVTLELALNEIKTLEDKVKRLEKQNQKLLEQFIRWQHNAYMMPGVDMDRLNQNLDKPLPQVNRR